MSVSVLEIKHLECALTRLTEECFGLSSLQLKACNGAAGHGVYFSQSYAQVDYLYHEEPVGLKYPIVHIFTELFPVGLKMLGQFIHGRIKPDGEKLRVLETLLSFIPRISAASKALQPAENREEGEKEDETEWSARLAVHFFSQLSMSQDYILDNRRVRKCNKCPCSCKTPINAGDTSIGHPKTWYGRFDILCGRDIGKQGLRGQRVAAEVDVGATIVPEDLSQVPDDDNSSDEDVHQTEGQSNDLQSHLSHFIAQTIVFSFYQKKLNQLLTFVPSIAVDRNHIQFHFYDCENDVYLVSQEMPLFVKQTLHLSTVLATWLVLNHRYLLSDATEEMLSEGKFGFHDVAQESLHLYKNEIKMGSTVLKPETFQLDVLQGFCFQSRKRRTEEILEDLKKKIKN